MWKAITLKEKVMRAKMWESVTQYMSGMSIFLIDHFKEQLGPTNTSIWNADGYWLDRLEWNTKKTW